MPALSRFWKAVGQQLRNPSGWDGRLIGRLMAIANHQSNRIAIRALDIAADDTILELGVGPGYAVATMTAISSRGRVLGIDHSATMLAQAARRNRRAIAKGRVCLLRGRCDALPCRMESIDKILAVHVLYFIGTREIREARRVLRPGGILAIFVADKSAMARWHLSKSASHRLFDQAGLSEILSLGGFASNEFTVSPMVLKFGIPGLLAVATKQPVEPRL